MRSLPPNKLLKLAALYSLTELPDCAAEILTSFRPLLEGTLDVAAGLDALTSQAAGDDERISYDEYMKEFSSDGVRFYGAGRMRGCSCSDLARALGELGREPSAHAYDEIPIHPRDVRFHARPRFWKAKWPIVITPPSEPWAIPLWWDVPKHGLKSSERALVRVTMSGVRGELWVAALACDGKTLLNSYRVAEGETIQETVLGEIDLDKTSRIVVRNGETAPRGAIALHGASVLLPKTPR